MPLQYFEKLFEFSNEFIGICTTLLVVQTLHFLHIELPNIHVALEHLSVIRHLDILQLFCQISSNLAWSAEDLPLRPTHKVVKPGHLHVEPFEKVPALNNEFYVTIAE
jgi:hypothetical protein